MAIEASRLAVYAGTRAANEPLFRYEYVRDPDGPIPTAHLQVHAHRDAFTHAQTSAGKRTKRGRRLALRGPDDRPQLSSFHFPLGGPRFRPCLEDILDVLQDEFGLDVAPGWRQALDDGRAQWRRHQTGAVVRDAPEVAVRVLRELGYQVSGPEVPERREHLVAL